MVLLAALALSFGVQDFIEGAVIAAVIVLNTTQVASQISPTISTNSTLKGRLLPRIPRREDYGFFATTIVPNCICYSKRRRHACSSEGRCPWYAVSSYSPHYLTLQLNVVAGDLVQIKTGDVVPADVGTSSLRRLRHRLKVLQLRLITVSNLEVSEQLLTGESIPGSREDHPFFNYF